MTLPAPAWRNRPGRDLIFTLAILYLLLGGYAFYLSRDLIGSLTSPLLLAMSLPIGLMHSVLTFNPLTIVGLVTPVALFVVLVLRMPGYVRIPLLVGMVVVVIYVTLQMGIVVN